METFKIKTHVGSDGILKFEMPVGLKDVDAEVIVIYSVDTKSSRQSWEDFIHATYGILADDPIERGDQGEYEIRDEIE